MSHCSIINTADWPDASIYKVRAHICFDPDSTLEDFEGYIEDDRIREAWAADDWHFVTLVVTASLNGIDLGTDALGGIEHGLFPTTDDQGNPTTEYLDCLDEPSYFKDQIEAAVRAADKALWDLRAAQDAATGA